MPGFVIHIAIAKEYLKKHKNEILDEEEFFKGAIAPDLNENFKGIAVDKSNTHYGIWGKNETTTNIDSFLRDNKVDIQEDYWKGYFLHLLADYYFYNMYFGEEVKLIHSENDDFYNDYDCLNKYLIPKYDIKYMDNIGKYMEIKDGNIKYLKLEKIVEYIKNISDFSIQERVNLIKKHGMEALK